MLKKSTANRQPPVLAEAKGGPKGIPAQPAQATARQGNSTAGGPLIAEAKGAKHNATFRAPRQEHSSPMECGFTKPGKM